MKLVKLTAGINLAGFDCVDEDLARQCVNIPLSSQIRCGIFNKVTIIFFIHNVLDMISISNYDIEDINCYHDREKLCVGFIVECNLDSEFGVIYQYNDETYSTECKNGGIYFFLKKKDYVIPQNTLVTFLKNLHNSWKKNFEVTNVCRLDEFENYILTSREEIESYARTSSTKKMEKLMSEGKKFLVAHYDEKNRDLTSRLYYPIINIEHKTIIYYFFTACSYFGPNTVFESYAFKLASKDALQYSRISNNFRKILKYIDSLDLETIISMYGVFDGGYFQCRPGRDDHYHFTKNTLCTSSDPYLNQLVKLGSVVTNYYCCQGRDEDDFSTLNFEETKALRDKIKTKYNSVEHFLYLNTLYLDLINKMNEDIINAEKNLTSFIRKGDESIFALRFSTLAQWKDFISSFNRF